MVFFAVSCWPRNISCLADKWQRRPFIKLNYNYGCHRKLTKGGRNYCVGLSGLRGSHIRNWLRLHFWCWCWLCHSACQIRALTAISCGFPAIPKAERSHSQSQWQWQWQWQMMRRHWGMRLKLFHFATISKVKRNLTAPSTPPSSTVNAFCCRLLTSISNAIHVCWPLVPQYTPPLPSLAACYCLLLPCCLLHDLWFCQKYFCGQKPRAGQRSKLSAQIILIENYTWAKPEKRMKYESESGTTTCEYPFAIEGFALRSDISKELLLSQLLTFKKVNKSTTCHTYQYMIMIY